MKRTGQNKGFTIVEMLTVMGIIAILIGLLVPALNQVKDYSRQVQQKSQFHSIDVALEMFKTDFGAYPESYDNLGVSTTPPVSPLAQDINNYGGAQKLAEAMVGMDLLGFHPRSGFRSDGMNYFSYTNSYQWVYNTTNGIQNVGPDSEKSGEENIKARKKYIDMENANAFRMQDVYNTNLSASQGGASGVFLATNYVLCDVYSKNRTSGKKTGMPILYFKARINYTLQDFSIDGVYTDDIYNYDDNRALVCLGTADVTPVKHELENLTGGGTNAYVNFERMILNRQVQQSTITAANPDGIFRPYRADSYILVSAGKDELYGTADDIFNFEKGSQQ
ncbi:MAG TPA: prepilin-type N-terminal cleavage/methylation domain-containing protein [Anaerohalosphaeraceae bacterium]|nr:prepilin-type N-terminal cleavage/methylation domain-containing protein [Anaerohalosphaeraceae bacterium]